MSESAPGLTNLLHIKGHLLIYWASTKQGHTFPGLHVWTPNRGDRTLFTPPGTTDE